MARITISIVATAWLLAATQVAAGPIATAGEPAATSELASLGGLLQALGAGVIGNGALLYPTAASSHQREEAEILASDTMTRVFKKVKSILKDGGINDDDNGDDESKSVTYLIKPAMIYHKEELPPPNPLAGNVLPLPGGALMYTPTPTSPNANEPTTGPAASIKAAYGNLFAASPYTPSYTLNKPHAAVIVEEITDMISLKSSLQRLEDKGEDADDGSDSDDEDDYGRKKHKKPIKIVSLETIDSTSAVVNPFTRADFPFGLMTPPMPAAPMPTPTNSRKTIKKTVSAKTSDQIRASMGKDGGITVVNNAVPSTTAQGSTIVIPAASLSSTHAPESSSSSAAPESSSAHEESKSEEPKKEESKSEEKGDDLKANEVTRMAHGHSTAHASSTGNTHVKGLRRDEATAFDPLKATSIDPLMATSAISTLASLASETALSASPTVTVGSTADEHLDSATDGPKRRKMRIVRVYEVKKSKGVSAMTTTLESSGVHKRDMMPVFDMEPTPSENPVRVGNLERAMHDEAVDNEEDAEETTVDVAAESGDSDMPASDMESDMPMSDESMADADKQGEASSTEAEVAKTEVEHNTTSKSMSIETIGAVTKDEELATSTNEPASTSKVAKSSKADSDSDSDSDNASGKADSDSDSASGKADSDSDSDSDNESEGAKDSDDESDDNEKDEKKSGKSGNKKDEDDDDEKDDDKDEKDTRARARARVAVMNRDDSMGAIQRVAALGLREAEKAIEDIELNSDVSDIEILTDDADMGTATSAILSPVSASGFERAAETPMPNHSADSSAHKRSIETPAHKRAADDDDDDDEDKADSPAKKDEDSDDDSDDKSADADSDSDSDSDAESSSSRAAKSATSHQKPRETMSVGTEEDEARKALSEAAAESFQQAVGVDAMVSESAMSTEAEEGSAVERNARESASDEHASDNMSDMDNMSDNASENASDEDFEFETEAGVNSDGEDVEFVTQLVPESERKNIHETPKVVVMASADEDDEDSFTNVKSDNIEDDDESMLPQHKGAINIDIKNESATRVQRNVADDDEPVVRGAEPTPDVGIIKESQNRAMNIGLGNLRRRA
ncbi:hypothetical protein IW148_001515 [Coemansia sp. RSA 1199]|nr:hypothetical protein IW148_001515 [Coemansia sp. RSA 1199]